MVGRSYRLAGVMEELLVGCSLVLLHKSQRLETPGQRMGREEDTFGFRVLELRVNISAETLNQSMLD